MYNLKYISIGLGLVEGLAESKREQNHMGKRMNR